MSVQVTKHNGPKRNYVLAGLSFVSRNAPKRSQLLSSVQAPDVRKPGVAAKDFSAQLHLQMSWVTFDCFDRSLGDEGNKP